MQNYLFHGIFFITSIVTYSRIFYLSHNSHFGKFEKDASLHVTLIKEKLIVLIGESHKSL